MGGLAEPSRAKYPPRDLPLPQTDNPSMRDPLMTGKPQEGFHLDVWTQSNSASESSTHMAINVF